jgi:hypothetical protein
MSASSTFPVLTQRTLALVSELMCMIDAHLHCFVYWTWSNRDIFPGVVGEPEKLLAHLRLSRLRVFSLLAVENSGEKNIFKPNFILWNAVA